jgi:glutathione peroxidase
MKGFMKKLRVYLNILPVLTLGLGIHFFQGVTAWGQEAGPASFFSIEARRIDGRPEKLDIYSGKVLLVVNTASRCGFTPQYRELQELFDRYKEKGLVVLAFPSNDFGNQEPGSNEEILAFCMSRYGVHFPLFEKNPVLGPSKQPVYKFLTETGPEELRGEVGWNFEKFLLDRKGRLRTRYGSFTNPLSKRLKGDIEKLLAEER